MVWGEGEIMTGRERGRERERKRERVREREREKERERETKVTRDMSERNDVDG